MYLLLVIISNMGASLSLLIPPISTKPPPCPGLVDLPENCVASVMLYLNPPDICKLSMLNRTLRIASSADVIWDSKLPTNYISIIQRIFGDDEIILENLCKRDVYSLLCQPIFYDGGSKKVWLDKCTGRVCLSISSKGLAITGADDRRYWSRIETAESRFQSIAYLQQIWWFEVDGEVDFPFPVGAYSIYFRLQVGRSSRRFGRRICNSEHVHGWDKKPVRFQLSTSDGQQATKQCYLKEPGKWMYQHVGDFVSAGSATPLNVKFSMTQIDCTHTKGGLCVDSVLICPHEFIERMKRF